MIQKIYCGYVIICDNCEHQASEPYDTWQDAVDAKKENGFKSIKFGNCWMDLCEDCQE